MPKTIYRDPAEPMIIALFGTEQQPVKLSVLSRQTGIPGETLKKYKKDPWRIPTRRMRQLIKARHLSDEEIVRMFR